MVARRDQRGDGALRRVDRGRGAPSASHRDGGARRWHRGRTGAALGGGECRGRRGGGGVRRRSFGRGTAVPARRVRDRSSSCGHRTGHAAGDRDRCGRSPSQAGRHCGLRHRAPARAPASVAVRQLRGDPVDERPCGRSHDARPRRRPASVAGRRRAGCDPPGRRQRAAAGVRRLPRPAAGGSFDWRAYLRRRGIAYELAVDSLADTGGRRGGPSGAIDSLRIRAEAALGAHVTKANAALARGMVLGQDELIDPLERDDFRRSGLAHVLAVSGQNVMLLCALALPLLAWSGAGPRTRVAVLLGLIAIYVPLAGAGPSLQRAGVMGAAGLVSLAAGRASSRWYALELAAVATLALNPRVAGDTGWQLSFAAVVGILVLAPPLQSALRGLPHFLAEGAAVTLAATIATAPLIAHTFGSVSVAGIGANLAA